MQQNEATPSGGGGCSKCRSRKRPQVSRDDFDRLKAENQLVKEERDQLLDRLARLQAEFENARKRAERERQEFREYAVGSVVEQFLPVLDNFELALKSAGTTEQLRSGVELIVKQMEDSTAPDAGASGGGRGRGLRSASTRGAGHSGARGPA